MSEKTVLVAVKVTAPDGEDLPDDAVVASYVNSAVRGDRVYANASSNGNGSGAFWEIDGIEVGAAAPS
jgi:hypothetical protein